MLASIELEFMTRASANLSALAIGLVAAMLAHAGPAGDTTYVTYSGTATDVRSGQFLYRENHVLQLRDGKIAGRVVLYTCQDGSAFARKTVSYVDPLSPDLLLEDASNGMREGIRSDGAARKVFFREGRSATEKISGMPTVNGLVADAGFDTFVRMNWAALIAGQSLSMHFLVPSRLDDVSFKVQHVRSDTTDGIGVEVFRLKVSGVVGWVAPSIDVYYDSKSQTLVRYVGLSDLRDRSNDNFQATIDFHPDERRPGDEQSMKTALQAHLAPCK